MKEKKQIVIWPVYLDAGRARNEGRLVAAASAITGKITHPEEVVGR